MKKIILFATALMAALSIMSFAKASELVSMDSYEYSSCCEDDFFKRLISSEAVRTFICASDYKSITVYKITMIGRVASSQSVQAEFNISSMELRVVERINGKNHTMTYSVVRNPYKGYSDDPRGQYDYCADCYYW